MTRRPEPVAIVGIGCRFPGGADSPERLWQLLCAGFDGIVEVPPYRFDWQPVYDPHPGTPGKMQSRHGGFLGPVDAFDAAFFGISPREAARVDPQQRLLLEVAWEALEDAGLPPERLPGRRAGVFLGMMSNDFEEITHRDPETLDLYGLNGAGRYGASGRLSFCLGLEGPSLCVDTACSSSLVAVHLACQSLRCGESEMALAGGSHLLLQPHVSIALSQGNILSPEGRCRFGDARAGGFVRGEGAALVALKLLRQAAADGDRVHAVILGSAVNSDGASNGVMATPSQVTQEEMLRRAYASAGVSPLAVRYVEAHGTGTTMGDRIELAALAAVLCAGRPAARPCRVGSIKTNIGHTEGASGVAGLIKLALCLEHRFIPPSLHCDTPSPELPWGRAPIELQRAAGPWPAEGSRPAIGGVNSFGLSGTNAHVVLQEPPRRRGARRAGAAAAGVSAAARPTAAASDGRPYLVALSARRPEALRALAAAWVERLADAGAPAALADIAHTAGSRRRHFEQRLAVVASSCSGLAAELRGWLADGGGEQAGAVLACGTAPSTDAAAAAGAQRRIAFVFPGQGAQWVGMGRELLAEPAFREAIERCDLALRAAGDGGLCERLESGDAAPGAAAWVDRIELAQPTLFAVQVALAALWRAWGVEPAAVVGHSLGEVAAAHVAGALSLADAARVVRERSLLLSQVGGRGAMLAVDLPRAAAAAAAAELGARAAAAVCNGPAATVLSGEPEAIEELAALLSARGVSCRRVKVEVAAHGPQVEPLLAPLAAALSGLAPRPAAIPFYSSVAAGPCDGASLDAAYWTRNLRQPVLFADALARLVGDGCTAFVEVSPHPLLLSAIEQVGRAAGAAATLALPSLRRGEGRAALLGSLARLYTLGHPVAWQQLDAAGAQVASLPAYPWQRERHWPRPQPAAGVRASPSRGEHALLGRRLDLASPAGVQIWDGELAADDPAWLADHRVHGLVVLPAAAYLEMAMAAARPAAAGAAAAVPVLADCRFERALVLPQGRPCAVQVVLTGGPAGNVVEIFSRDDPAGGWVRHASARVGATDAAAASTPAPAPPDELRRGGGEELDGEAFYRAAAARGLDYGPAFRGVARVFRRDGEALAQLRPVAEAGGGFLVPPALLDACFQVLLAALPGRLLRPADTWIPVSLRELRVWRLPAPGESLWAHAVATAVELADGSLGGDLALLDAAGEVLLAARDLVLRRIAAGPAQQEDRLAHLAYEVRWQTAAAPTPPAAPAPGTWLLLAADSEWTRGLAALLEKDGSRCLLARPGASFRSAAGGVIELSPADPEGFARLLDLASAATQPPPLRGVVHLWSLAAAPAGEPDVEALAEVRRLGCESALLLAQAMARRGTPDRLWLVTAGAQAVGGAELNAPFGAPLVGLGRVIATEHPELAARRVDVDPRQGPEALARELGAAGGDGEPELALRGAERWVPRLAPAALPADPAAAGAAPLFAADGTYLLTGGLGGVGLAVARWLVERGVRHLVLAGRRGPAAAAAAAVAAIAALGARVVVEQADVAAPAAVARLLARVASELPPLAGVFHLAGVLDDAPLRELDGPRLRRVMAPKVAGAWNLHLATRELPLTHFVLFSSAASVLGTHGQASYAAANAFLDALAHHRRALGLPALAVCWGAWAEVGLAAREGWLAPLAARGMAALAPAEACAVLGRLLRQTVPQVAVMDVDWPRWLAADAAARRSPLLARVAAASAAAATDGAGNGAGNGAGAAESLEARLRRMTADVLRLPQHRLDEGQALIRQGLDSLMALDLKVRLDAGVGVSLPVTRLLQGLSFRQLVAEVQDKLHAAATAAVPAPTVGAAADTAWEEIEL